MLPLISSRTMKRAVSNASIVQPGSTAIDDASGNAAAMIGPMNGTKHQHVTDGVPQSGGFGTPISPRPMPIGTPSTAFNQELHQQVSPNPLRSIAQRLCGSMQIVCAHQANEPVAEILPLQQHKYDEYDNDAARRQRLDEGPTMVCSICSGGGSGCWI